MSSNQSQELIRAVEQADSAPSLVAAVRKLAAAKECAGISTLIAVLGYNNPSAAVAAQQGLVALGAEAVQPLIEQLDGYNYGARAYAIRALAAIADPYAIDVLVTAATTDFAPSVRRAAAKGLGLLHWHQLDSVQARTAAQTKALQTLLSISTDSEWSIRYAAIVGLQALATTTIFPQIQDRLAQLSTSDSDLAVRARAQLAQTQA